MKRELLNPAKPNDPDNARNWGFYTHRTLAMITKAVCQLDKENKQLDFDIIPAICEGVPFSDFCEKFTIDGQME